jgi:hypothetical protein
MSIHGGATAPIGDLSLRVLPGGARAARHVSGELAAPDRHGGISMSDVVRYGLPRRDLPDVINQWKARNAANLWRGVRRVGLARALRLPTHYGALWLRVLYGSGEQVDLGLVSLRVITTTGVGYIVDAFANSVELENMKFHGLGTGTGAEAAGDTALGTELSTEYTGNVRATGSTTEGASANIYRTVGTNTLDSGTPAVTEHGVLSQAAPGGGVLLDRSVFAAINLVGANGDGIQSTYDATFTAGS